MLINNIDQLNNHGSQRKNHGAQVKADIMKLKQSSELLL